MKCYGMNTIRIIIHYANISNSKILTSNDLFKIGTSSFLSILFEIQGVIITLVIVGHVRYSMI